MESSCAWLLCVVVAWSVFRRCKKLYRADHAGRKPETQERHGASSKSSSCADSQLYENEKLDQQKFAICVLKLFFFCFYCVISEHSGYVMLEIMIFVLVYSLTSSEEAVTFPDISCFITRRSSLCQTHFVITPILNYPKHVSLHYSF